MDTVNVWNATGIVMDEADLSLTELPPVPFEFAEELRKAGGETGSYPNIRVVSGLDPEIVEFVGGRWWMKYATREHDLVEYTLLHKPDGSKTILSPKEAKVASKMKNLKGILIPVKEHKIKEFGIPRYFVEYYKAPEYFGSPELWEKERWFLDEDGKTIDLMGEFPHNGAYETLFCIEEAIEDDGVVIGTRFRQLDDVALELIKFKIEEMKGTTAAEQHDELRKEVDSEYIQHKADLKEDIRDRVADRIDRIIE